MTGTPDIDQLLSAPLPGVPDDEFSARIASRIAAQERVYAFIELGAVLGFLTIVALYLPVGAFIGPVTQMSVYLASSLPFAAACAALVLTYEAIRAIPD
jgi:hypothetical protein